MSSLLITLLVLVIVCAIVYWIIGLIPLPQPVKNIILAVCGLILLVYLLGQFGILGEGFHIRR